jgi:general secretion pathway protein B
VQKSVARINVAGFSYSDDPQARMAVINDRILHEGDEVVSGVKLEKIGSDGIILSHRGIRFRP